MDNYKKIQKGAQYGIPGTAQYELLKSQGKIPADYIKEMENKKDIDISEYEKPSDLKPIANLREFPEQDPFKEEKEAAKILRAMQPSVEEMMEKRLGKLREIAPKKSLSELKSDDPDVIEAQRLIEERKKIKLDALNKLRGEN